MSETNSDSKKINLILLDDEAENIRLKIEDLKPMLYRTDFVLENYVDEHFTAEQKDHFLSSVLSLKGKKEIEAELDNILASFKDMEDLTLKLSFDPTVSFITWLKEFLAENVNGSTVVKIVTDRSLIAGVVLEYKGRLENLTVKEKFLGQLKLNGLVGGSDA